MIRNVFIICMLLLISCGENSKQEIGGEVFCIPKDQLSDDGPWWVPSDLPEGGIRAELPDVALMKLPNYHPLVDSREKNIPLRVIISEAETWRSWEQPPADSHYGKLIRIPLVQNSRIQGTDLMVVYTDRDRSNWLIITRQPETSGAPAEDLDTKIIAVCSISTSLNSTPSSSRFATCTRALQSDRIVVLYTFDERNLPILTDMDALVFDAVDGMKCK